MKPVQLLKTLLPGLLPLFIFILADEIWGTKIGLYVAVGFGVVQILVIYLKEKRLDKFVLFDTLLIVVMGLVSIVLENDIFFKLKQGIIGIILVLILGISAYSPKNIMLMMSQRYLNGINISGEHQKYMTRSIKILFWLFLIHTCLVFYSAFFMTKEAWGFISGVLFYMIFGAFFLVELIKNLIIRNKLGKVNDEYLAHVDEEGNIIGRIGRVQAHNGSKQLHPVIHVHIFNNELKILLQKRSLNKKVQPGKWDTAVGGHVSYREPIEKAIEREAFEELGLKDLKYSFLTKYIWESEIEKEMVFVFVAQIHAIKFIPNKERITIQTEDHHYLINRAKITSIQQSQVKGIDYQAKLMKIKSEKQKDVEKISCEFEFIIDDNTVYYKSDDFKSHAAKQSFTQYQHLQEEINALSNRLEQDREAYTEGDTAKKDNLTQSILSDEEKLEYLIKERNEMVLKVRNTEIKYIKNSN